MQEPLSKQTNLMFAEYPDVVDVPQMCKMLGNISHKTGYRLLKENKLHSLKVGREYRIPKLCIIEYLTGSHDENDEQTK